MIRCSSGCLKPLSLHNRFVLLIQILAGNVVLRNLKRNHLGGNLGSLEFSTPKTTPFRLLFCHKL